MSHYLFLVAASILFVGSHFLMSHPWRADMVRRFGANGFLGLYSLVSFATFGWMLLEFGRAPKGDALWPASDAVWIVASVLTLVAAVLFSGSFIRNPSLPGVPDAMAGQTPFGVFKATRHPMMWGFALEIKKRKLMGAQWDGWLRRTHFAIQPVALFKVGIGPWLAGIILWAAATWAHPYWNVAGAGLFRWFSV
ncbi:MAG: hypothetical protein RLZZ191_769 [Pseudomonadota bacterium]